VNYTNGISVAICRTPVSENPTLAGLKHLCRLEQVLGQAELKTTGAAEGLMLGTTGHVIGGTMSNLFCVERGALYTPRLDRAGVRGVMRRIAMTRATGLGISVHEDDLTLARLEQADEVFVTNAVFGLWPVREIGAIKVPSMDLAKRLMREIGIDDGG
jgi:4-amino-4-deoxychorismate lyase